MAEASERKAASLKRVWEGEMEMNERVGELERAVHTYNSKAQALQLIPLGAKNSGGKDYELAVMREFIGDEERMLSNDIRGKIRPALSGVKEAVVKRMHEVRQELLELLDAEEASEEELAELMDANGQLEAKAKRAEETYKREKEMLDETISHRMAEAEALEQRLLDLKDPGELNRLLEKENNKMAELNNKLLIEREAHNTEKEALHRNIIDAITMATDAKEAMQQQLGELAAAAEMHIMAVEQEPLAARLAMEAPLDEPGNADVNVEDVVLQEA
ncbi:unnamed protein product [Chrysoparadoxa australica]